MLIEQLLKPQSDKNYNEIRSILIHDCSQFIGESGGIPLLRSLPQHYNDFHKVKARKNKHKTTLGEVFDEAFNSNSLMQRAVFAYPHVQYESNELEPFYVFPVNGYKFLYCKEITNSKQEHMATISTLIENIDNEIEAKHIMSGVLQYSYVNTNLMEGIQSNAEIIFHGIPYYYAIRSSTYTNYNKLIEE